MYNRMTNSSAGICAINNDMILSELYVELRSLARYLVGFCRIPSWHGQEDDIVEDVVQETLRRLIERVRQGENGEKAPVHSLKHMMVTIAYNYYRDLCRHDRRLSRLETTDDTTVGPVADNRLAEYTPLLESVTENVYHELLFVLVAQEVEHFPNKQRTALLVDLANMMHFDEAPTPLQSAFLQVGIQLKQYQRPLPENPKERSRHISLLCHAYKRVAHLSSVESYI